jgi:hypothetical protein
MNAPCARSQAPAQLVHLELFANRRVVIVPARIGVRSATCRARLWTFDPTGVVAFRPRATLGELFTVWGRALMPRRLLTFAGRVRLYVDGVQRRTDPRALVLRRGAEIVLEVGGYVPPHGSYVFPRHWGPGVP